MPKSYKPTTPSRRFITTPDFSDLTRSKPEKSLTLGKRKSGGRNNTGMIMVRHIGGGHKRLYRQVDFKREKFGVPCKPQLGAIMVYWRGSKAGTSGHVAFCAGESVANFYNLGGNQSNAVTVAPLTKTRLLGARWPRTVPIPTKLVMPKLVGGKLSTNEE